MLDAITVFLLFVSGAAAGCAVPVLVDISSPDAPEHVQQTGPIVLLSLLVASAGALVAAMVVNGWWVGP